MRRYLLFILSFCGWQVVQGQTGSTCYYWFDSDYTARQTVVLQDGSLNAEIDVSALTDAVHTIHFQVTDEVGVQTPTASHLFVKLPQKEEAEVFTHDGKCRYWFDEDDSGGQNVAVGDGLMTLDVSQLKAGIHTVHFQGSGSAMTPVSSKLFVILPKKEATDTKITKYDYWLNGSGAPTSVVLPEPVSPLSLVDLLPVPAQPFRSQSFHFAIDKGKPVLYAKNDIRLRFYSSETHFADVTAQYVDYGVTQAVGELKVLEPGVRQTETKPAANTIIWYQVAAEAGDNLHFKVDKAATIQLFSPSGQEVYAAKSSAAINWGGVNAEETGTYYLALHDVTATKGTTISIDYEHIDKYAVLRQDVATVGNGGPSTITFQGNGFDELTSVDLKLGNSIITSTDIQTEGKAAASVEFNFDGVALGQYQAVFHFQEDDVVVDHCLTVEEAVPVMVSATVSHAKTFLLSRGNEYAFKVKNNGNMTAYHVPLMLTVYTTSTENLLGLTINGEEVATYSEVLEDATFDGYPYKRIYNITPTLRPNMSEPLLVRVKTLRTEGIHVYLGDVGGQSNPVTSIDPNDIYGYQDADGDKIVRDGLTDLWYTIEFENDPAFATASAHDIFITDQLSTELFDLSTFSPTRIKIGNKETELPGGTSGVTTINMQPEIYAVAQVEWTLDTETGTASWHISSLDPMTMEPTEDISQGVLPVNSDGNGLGQLSFDIQLKPGLPNNTKVTNKATITFDENAPIETPTWTNTVENLPKGDVNGDGEVNLTDASWIVRHYVGRTPEGFRVNQADVNSDGSINLSDAQKVVRIFVGKDNQ